MGFFDLKADCGVCGKEAGLNRFKVKKSNAWICPECLKKAGGASSINVAKVTIEDLRELIMNNSQQQEMKTKKLANSSMQTAEDMYNYCIKNGYGSGMNEKWGIKHFQVIKDSLMDGELILTTFIGLHNYESPTKHGGNFAYAITNKRIIIAQKNTLSGQTLQTVSLNNINDITFKSGMVLGTMTIDTTKEKFNVGLDKNSAQKINSKVTEVIHELKNTAQTEVKDVITVSAADELKKFKGLLDEGIISEEEFTAKKKQLLGL